MADDSPIPDAVFDDYFHRLVQLARSRLSHKLARNVDPESVVQSAYGSLVRGVRDGRIRLQPGGKLWQLLATMTIRKVLRRVEYYTAAKRAVDRECRLDDSGAEGVTPAEAVARELPPDAEALFQEEWQQATARLSPLHRRMVELTVLDGLDAAVVAQATDRSAEMVRLVLRRVEADLRQRLQRPDEC
jgi:RNA polymerase sigma-70 factor, ECF subfamily